MKESKEKIKRLIVVLILLLSVLGTILGATIIYKYSGQKKEVPVRSTDNIITSEKEAGISMRVFPVTGSSLPTSVVKQDSEGDTALKLCRRHAEDSTRFYAANLFPGDTVKKDYLLQVSYKGSVTVNFRTEIKKGYEKLAEVLQCRVKILGGKTLYDGQLNEMPQVLSYVLPKSSGETKELQYEIDISLDTSVGNEFMNQELIADFVWWVNADSEIKTDSSQDTSTVVSGENSEKDPVGELIRPKTGDDSRMLVWILGTGGSLGILLLLLFVKKRKKEEKAGDE